MNKVKLFILLILVSFLSLFFVGNSNDLESVVASNVPSSKEVATQTINALNTKVHPYISYEENDISSLKEKVKSGYSQKAYEYLEKTSKNYLKATINVTANSNGIIGRQLQSYIAYLSTYGVLNNDTTYKNKAKELVINSVNSGNIEIYKSINDALSIADFGYAYALAYDWLYNDFTVSERNLIKNEMEEIGNWLFTNSKTINTWGSEEIRRKAWNWNAVTHGALGMISLSLGTHADWLELAVERVKGYYTYAVDNTGAAIEGLHYIGYAFNTLAVFDNAIYNLIGVELLDCSPQMQKLPHWSMMMTAPYGNEQAAINQGSKLDNCAATFYIINRYNQKEALWGWEQTYNLEGEGKFTSDYQGNGWNIPAIIFYENKNITPTKPRNMVTTVTYDKGLVVSRDGWDKDDSMITFTSGWGYGGTWNHPDDNSFTFFAKGESFVIDLGANYKKSSEHNLVSVDGNGMRYEGGSSMIEGHILINKKLPNGVLYLKGDNSDSYKDDVLTTSTRQLIYKGGEVPYTLVFDYAVSSNSKHTYTTNFYTDKDSTINILGTNKAKIIGGNNNESCYVYTYSLDGTVILSEIKTDKTLAITTNNSSNVHKQATLFITNDNLGNDPIVEWNKIDGKLEIKIKYKVGTTEYIDTYFLSVNEEVVYTQTIIEPKHVHDLVKIEEVSATCTTKGNILYYHCNDCGENFTDVDGLNKVNKVEIDAKGHDYGEWNEEILPTKNSLGVVGHYYCSECDKYFDEYYDELDDIYLEYHDNSTTVNNGCYGQIAASLFGVMFLGACIVFVRKKYNL